MRCGKISIKIYIILTVTGFSILLCAWVEGFVNELFSVGASPLPGRLSRLLHVSKQCPTLRGLFYLIPGCRRPIGNFLFLRFSLWRARLKFTHVCDVDLGNASHKSKKRQESCTEWVQCGGARTCESHTNDAHEHVSPKCSSNRCPAGRCSLRLRALDNGSRCLHHRCGWCNKKVETKHLNLSTTPAAVEWKRGATGALPCERYNKSTQAVVVAAV